MLIEISITLEAGTTLEQAQEYREHLLNVVRFALERNQPKAIIGSSLTVDVTASFPPGNVFENNAKTVEGT